MSRGYLPTIEAELDTWVTGFENQVSQAPTDYGLTNDMVAELTTKATAFRNARQAASVAATRTPQVVAQKNQAKAELIAYVRQLVRLVQATPGITNDVRIALGITPRKEEYAPVPVPANSPDIDVLSVNRLTVRVHLHEASPAGGSSRRGKPDGVAGALVYSYVGAEPPESLSAWKFETNTKRTTVSITFPPTVPAGAKVWITAVWYNPRGQNGPQATPISTSLQYGGMSEAA